MHLIKSYLLYTTQTSPPQQHIRNTLATDPIERLHLSLLKWTLGVSKYMYTSNTTNWGDTGRHSMIISLTKLIFIYLGRLQKMDEDNSQALVRHALREQEELGLDWFNKLQRLKAVLEHRYKNRSYNPARFAQA